MSSSSTTANARLRLDGDPIADAEALIEQGRAGEAVSLLKEWIAADRGGLMIRLMLARALMESGDSAGALETARETSLLYSNAADAIVGLGEALLRAGHLTTAIPEFQRATRLDPDNERAQFLLGCAWLEAGEAEKALAVFEACAPSPETDAKISEARVMLARPRSDPRYVRHLFDQFSADYDQRMIGQLSYRAPQILHQLAGFTMPGRQELRILDLGCGTGLTGEVFEEMASQLDGIDLSPAMIEKARARRIYDELAVSDLETFLVESNRQYDLILAADTLVYLGDLARVFSGAARQLAPDGFFLFTVEKKDGEGFELGPKRRWRHSEDYLTALAFQVGLSVAGILECVPRMEANRPVDGFAVALMRGNG
jgi:predicted TPR repeat methyltransferase